MGFWGAIKNAFATVGRAIKSAVKSFANVIAGNKPSKVDYDETAQTFEKQKRYDQFTATVDETVEMDRIVADTRNKYYDKLNNIEKATIECSRKTFDTMIEEIKNIIDKNKIDFNVRSVEYDFENIIRRFKNTFSDDITRHIALSDRKFSSFLSISNSSERGRKISSYIEELINDAKEEYYKNIDKITNDSLGAISKSINDNISNIEKSIDNIKNEIEENRKLKEAEIEPKRKEYEEKEQLLNDFINVLDNE
ncbi:hypothetical protein [Brachyspira catarrhinii]|uniref:Uncharacterized protein n=1 Tax=Brachyspira catarrhinii TaxID=2528966 RepID=A0ABY2TP60_9SPIR|nr:hypothetical protein [Brachyspira catarrhinii]TKZ32326.1 hypothetical protein EZH24_09285 [Brachyspira catarrhinii]